MLPVSGVVVELLMATGDRDSQTHPLPAPVQAIESSLINYAQPNPRDASCEACLCLQWAIHKTRTKLDLRGTLPTLIFQGFATPLQFYANKAHLRAGQGPRETKLPIVPVHDEAFLVHCPQCGRARAFR